VAGFLNSLSFEICVLALGRVRSRWPMTYPTDRPPGLTVSEAVGEKEWEDSLRYCVSRYGPVDGLM